ncbi:MAG TPA: hypothetical protein VN256_04135 [Pyrinomonadaceae bacterium]|nr:hypothetical protein [Pyrinomonadaceae bacterium]
MRDRSKQCAPTRGLVLAGLAALMILAAACQSGGADNNLTPRQDDQAAGARGGAETQNEQAGNAVPTNSATAGDSGGGNANAPRIRITLVPPAGGGPDSTERIGGTVSGVKARDCKVILFTRTNRWYVQPWEDSPYTEIREDGSWENDTHLGSEYAALLVKASYKLTDLKGTLPVVSGPVLAMDRVPAK